MWLLINIENDTTYCLNSGFKQKYSVGRSNADILIQNDASISRTHAFLHIKQNANEVLELEDAGSTYGTSLLKAGTKQPLKVSKNKRLQLANADCIQFGALQQVWRCQQLQIVNLCTALTQSETTHLQDVIQALGGVTLGNWQTNCTHLTMNAMKMTVKLLFALVQQLQIVKCKYWQDLLTASRATQPLAGILSYLPDRSTLLLPRAERKRIFAGKTFVFMNRLQCDTYSALIELAGGQSENFLKGVRKSTLLKKNVAVIQYINSTQTQSSQQVEEITEYITRNKRRLVPEYEIGLAILHCNTEKYCNADFTLEANLLPTCMDTDDISNDNLPPTVYIPDTDESSNDMVSHGLESVGTEKSSNELIEVVPDSSASTANLEHIVEPRAEVIGKTRKRRVLQVLDSSDDNDDDGSSIAALKKRQATNANANNIIDIADSDNDNAEDEVLVAAFAKRPNTRQSASSSNKSAEANTISASQKRMRSDAAEQNDGDGDVDGVASKRRNTRQSSKAAAVKSNIKALPLQVSSARKTRSSNALNESLASDSEQQNDANKVAAKTRSLNVTINSIRKPKITTAPVADDSDKEDEELFAFAKSPKLQKTPNKSRQCLNTEMSMSSSFRKPSSALNQTVTNSQGNASKASVLGAKRSFAKLVFEEEDDNDDDNSFDESNLFNFGGDKKKPKMQTQTQTANAAIDVEEEYLTADTFDPTIARPMPTEQQKNLMLARKQQIKPITLPKQICTNGWLQKSHSEETKPKLKSATATTNHNLEEMSEKQLLEMNEFIKSLQNKIVVREVQIDCNSQRVPCSQQLMPITSTQKHTPVATLDWQLENSFCKLKLKTEADVKDAALVAQSRSKIVVKEVKLPPRKSFGDLHNNTSSTSSNGNAKNFKRFKKQKLYGR